VVGLGGGAEDAGWGGWFFHGLRMLGLYSNDVKQIFLLEVVS
jgi:hypothetical protein